jgi:hypothetical protein
MKKHPIVIFPASSEQLRLSSYVFSKGSRREEILLGQQ